MPRWPVIKSVAARVCRPALQSAVWINRLGERAEPAPTRELPDLHGLADVLDELAP
jgi:hypothetical protein